MIIDQFRESDLSNDIEALKVRARAFSLAGTCAYDIPTASKFFARSRAFANKAHELENNQRRLTK